MYICDVQYDIQGEVGSLMHLITMKWFEDKDKAMNQEPVC